MNPITQFPDGRRNRAEPVRAHKLTDFLRKTFCDATGTPDGKLLTIAGVALIVMATFPVGWIFHIWPPEYIWSPTLLFLAAGLGIDAYVTRAKIQADAPPPPPPSVEVKNVENVTLPPSE